MKDKRTTARSKKDLDHLRVEIQQVTRSILDLAKARQNLSRKVALVKESTAIPIENVGIESRLVSSMKKYSKNIGLDPMLSGEITKALVESSKSVQRKAIYLDKIRKYLAAHGVSRVGIIGAGRMGGWFAGYFKSLRTSVLLFDDDRKFGKRRAKELACRFSESLEVIEDSDLIVVAVPIGKTASVTNLLAKHAGERKMRIIEISSVKQRVIGGIKRHSQNVEIYSIHPLFGASADPFARNSMIVMASGGQDEFVSHLFPHFAISNLDPNEHDKLMTLLLSLPHVLALTFADIVLREKDVIPKGISSPTFESFIQIARRVLSESAEVYYEIQSTNKHNQKMLKQIEKSQSELRSIISQSDYARFVELFDERREMLSKVRGEDRSGEYESLRRAL